MSSGKTCRAIRVPGGRLVRLETDLAWGRVQQIAEEHELNILYVLSAPEIGTGAALEPLYRLACEEAGVEVPEKLTARVLLEALETVEDDLPEEYTDGIPKEGETSTT
jgi:hypothetical protein